MTRNTLKLIVIAPVLLLITALTFAVKMQLALIYGLGSLGKVVGLPPSRTTTSPSRFVPHTTVNKKPISGTRGGSRKCSNPNCVVHTENGVKAKTYYSHH